MEMTTQATDAQEFEELDVEAFAKENPADREKPHARSYIIRIDRERERVSEPSLTGAQILALVGKTPESHKLFQKFRGGEVKVIEPEERVSFIKPGVERFQTIPKDTTEGAPASELRRHFQLPEVDCEYLDRRGLLWEAVLDRNARWVLVHRYPLVGGYNHANASVGLELSQSYPDTQIDMVYFYPQLARVDGKPIRQLRDRSFDGKVWQRWSRHRTKANPWRRGYDCLETHLLLIEEWLEREQRRAA